MKKLGYIMSIVACMALVSCENEIDNWYSATFDYSGRFVYALYADDGVTEYIPIEDGSEIYIYNTAANVAGEVWIDDTSHNFPFKGKVKITGSPTSFSSSDGINILSELENDASDAPTALGQTSDGTEWYARVQVLEGKILPKAGTSIGGNTVDSFYLKVVLHSDVVTFESVQKDASKWADPAVPEFEWKVKSSKYDSDLDETYIISGYRYTGYPEDF